MLLELREQLHCSDVFLTKMPVYLIKYSPAFIDNFKPGLVNYTFVYVSSLGAELQSFYLENLLHLFRLGFS